MALENRLSAEQLAALAPGDAVTIECAGDFRRPRYFAGTVVRVTDSRIVVSIRSAKGVSYQEQYQRRDGVREGRSLVRAELVNPNSVSPGGQGRRHTIDVLYRDWTRNRSDLERLQRLHVAISERLDEGRTSDTGSSKSRAPADEPRSHSVGSRLRTTLNARRPT